MYKKLGIYEESKEDIIESTMESIKAELSSKLRTESVQRPYQPTPFLFPVLGFTAFIRGRRRDQLGGRSRTFAGERCPIRWKFQLKPHAFQFKDERLWVAKVNERNSCVWTSGCGKKGDVCAGCVAADILIVLLLLFLCTFLGFTSDLRTTKVHLCNRGPLLRNCTLDRRRITVTKRRTLETAKIAVYHEGGRQTMVTEKKYGWRTTTDWNGCLGSHNCLRN